MVDNKPLVICIATTSFPRWKGDIRAPFVYGLAKALKEKGITIHVVTMHAPGAMEREILDGIEVHRIRYMPDKYETLQKDTAGLPSSWNKGFFNKLLFIPYGIAFMIGIVRYARGCDLIHANWSLSGLGGLLAKKLYAIPYLVTVQGSDVLSTHRMPLVSSLNRLVFSNAAMIITLSLALKDSVQSLHVKTTPITVIPNGVDINTFQSSTRRRQNLLLTVGSLIDRKGYHFLLNAMPEFFTSHPDYRLAIIGEGPKLKEYQALCEQLGLTRQVRFIGVKSQKEVKAWMQKAKIFVLPSLEEGQGVVFVEALACGTPCIGTKVGGIQDVITPDVGVLVKPRDSSEITKAACSLIEDERKWKRFSIQARNKAETKYNWNTIAEQIKELYIHIIRNTKK